MRKLPVNDTLHTSELFPSLFPWCFRGLLYLVSRSEQFSNVSLRAIKCLLSDASTSTKVFQISDIF